VIELTMSAELSQKMYDWATDPALQALLAKAAEVTR
jgi:hypothetical protein